MSVCDALPALFGSGKYDISPPFKLKLERSMFTFPFPLYFFQSGAESISLFLVLLRDSEELSKVSMYLEVSFGSYHESIQVYRRLWTGRSLMQQPPLRRIQRWMAVLKLQRLFSTLVGLETSQVSIANLQCTGIELTNTNPPTYLDVAPISEISLPDTLRNNRANAVVRSVPRLVAEGYMSVDYRFCFV